MPHVNDGIDREIRRTLNRVNDLENASASEFIRMVDELRQRVVVVLVENGTLDANNASYIKSHLDSILSQYKSQFENVLSENQRKLFVKGIQTIDAAVEGAGILKAVPLLGDRLLTQVQNFGAELITGLLASTRSQIATQIDLAVLGQKPMNDVVRDIAGKLPSASVFGTMRRRAELIVRTEVNRIHSLAAQARMEQVATIVPDMKKEWLHSHLGFPRAGHLALDGVVIKADEKFQLEGADGITYQVDAPYDPILPAGETISCRCRVIGIIGRYEKTKSLTEMIK